MIRLFPALALGAALGAASPAAAQGIIPSVIGATIANMAANAAEAKCLRGEAPPAGKVESARAGAESAMRQYLTLAARPGPVDASAAFTARAKRKGWQLGGVPGATTRVDDPLARALAAAGRPPPAPAAFYRASDGQSSLGVWVLPSAASDGAAAPLGHYRVSFRREAEIWRIHRLELAEGAADPAPASQYCHKPGDVEENQALIAEWEAKRAEKKAEKEARRAARETGG
jgi:hypothetical protein